MRATSIGRRSHGGARLPHHKGTAELPSVVMPTPATVTILMCQHLGVPCKPVVKVGDMVKTGQLIGDSDKFMSAPIHSSITGKVKAITEVVAPDGTVVEAVVIAADGEDTLSDTIAQPKADSYEEFIAALRASGLVGLGGAGFPTHIKLKPAKPEDIEFLVVNAAECEPFITADYRTLMEDTDDVLGGIAEIKKHLDIKTVYLGIEENKPEAIKLYKERFASLDGVAVAVLRTSYPQGAEKTLIYETTGRVVPEGALPSAVGTVVCNVSTVAFISKYLRTGIPLVHKRVTVDGGAVAEPKNVIVPVGASVADIVAFCGGYKQEPRKVILGGPMMGNSLADDAYPICKTTNAIVAFTEKETAQAPQTNCIRCSRCIYRCPMSLMPASFEKAYFGRNEDELRALKVNLCIECGTCSYVCPAKRNLVHSIKLGKRFVLEESKKRKAGGNNA